MKSEEPSIFISAFHINPNKKYAIEPLCAPKMVLDIEECETKDGTNIFFIKA